jgi:hypothetical protein
LVEERPVSLYEELTMGIEEFKELHGEAMTLGPEYDCAIVGFGYRCGLAPVIVYDEAEVVSVLMSQGMDIEDAWEWFDFNIAGAYVGERTPMFISLWDRD